MTKPINLIAFDGNWLTHRAYHAAHNIPDEDARARTVARMAVRWVFAYALQYQCTHFFVGFDGPKCFRYKVWPLYKFSRKQYLDPTGQPMEPDSARKLVLSGKPIERVPDAIHDVQLLIQHMLGEYSVPVVQDERHEADDLLASASSLPARFPAVRKVTMFTKDKDAIGSVKPGVVQAYPDVDTKKPHIQITHKDLSVRLTKYVHQDAAEWSPLQFRDYQILIGDPTDDVPDILTKGQARKILNTHGSLRAYFDTKEGKKFYAKNQEALIRNRKLVVMKTDLLDDYDLNLFKFVQRPLAKDLIIQSGPSLRQAYEDYCGWVKLSSRKSLFG